MLWSTPYIQRLSIEAEATIASMIPCIIDRISFATAPNQSIFQLPEYVQDITRVYWKGVRLDPIGNINSEAPYAYGDGFEISTGKPLNYRYSKFGENVIKLYPSSNETLIENILDPWNDTADSFVIEFYRISDEIHQIPKYIRRRVIKAYVCWKAFQKEGDGQNLKAAEYWKNQFLVQIKRCEMIIDNITKALIRTRQSVPTNNYVAKPVLPWNWMTVSAEDDDC